MPAQLEIAMSGSFLGPTDTPPRVRISRTRTTTLAQITKIATRARLNWLESQIVHKFALSRAHAPMALNKKTLC